jgi:hypothetical protein
MGCDLERVFGALARQVPDVETESMALSAASLPVPPAEMSSDRLYIARGRHEYESYYWADALWFYAGRPTYRQLALLILAVVFHPQPVEVHLALTHPASAIRHLIVRYAQPEPETHSGYLTRPYALSYWPEATSKHPWADTRSDREELPCFWLTNREESIGRPEEWERRDTIVGFGTDRASVRLAELLLNASRPDNPVVEYELESEAGFGGVGRWSAEARFWLPGSYAWDPSQWPPA